MNRDRRPLPPLDRQSLDRLALRYVERFATTRARLAAYLDRKIRERGTDGDAIDTAAIAQRFADLGYIDDRAFAEARMRSMTRRGFGERRIVGAFRQDGIAPEDAAALSPEIEGQAVEAALALARRKRIGPFAIDSVDRVQREKQLAAMVRGGHGFTLSRRIVAMEPGADLRDLCPD
ncbi:regulatory protein RecX [Sphingomonas koreensis]|nr:regulatory protein RecX [Sphingomonas koreensis]